MLRLNILFVLVATLLVGVQGWQSHVLKDLVVGEWAPPGPDDLRSPCPGLNVLANHGYLPRNGQNITLDIFLSALMGVYNLSIEVASPASTIGIELAGENGMVSLGQLNKHGPVEHDASMTRLDAYFGNNHILNADLYAGFMGASSDGKVLTVEDIANWNLARQNASRYTNFTFGTQEQFAAAGAPSLILGVFGVPDEEGNYSVSLSRIQAVFGEEKLPSDWNTSTTSISGQTISAFTTKILNIFAAANQTTSTTTFVSSSGSTSSKGSTATGTVSGTATATGTGTTTASSSSSASAVVVGVTFILAVISLW